MWENAKYIILTCIYSKNGDNLRHFLEYSDVQDKSLPENWLHLIKSRKFKEKAY